MTGSRMRTRRCPDVECQAVFAHSRSTAVRQWLLHAVVAELGRIPRSAPSGDRLRRLPTKRADRRLRIRDALKDRYAVRRRPRDASHAGMNGRCLGLGQTGRRHRQSHDGQDGAKKHGTSGAPRLRAAWNFATTGGVRRSRRRRPSTVVCKAPVRRRPRPSRTTTDVARGSIPGAASSVNPLADARHRSCELIDGGENASPDPIGCAITGRLELVGPQRGVDARVLSIAVQQELCAPEGIEVTHRVAPVSPGLRPPAHCGGTPTAPPPAARSALPSLCRPTARRPRQDPRSER